MNKIAFLSLLIFVLACSEKENNKVELHGFDPNVISEFDSSTNYYSTMGIRKLMLTSPKHYRYKDNSDLYPQGVYLELYEQDGSVSTTLRADYGFSKNNPKEVLYGAYGNIVVHNVPQDQKLLTDTLYWDQKTQIIYTFSPIEIITPTEHLKGKGLTAKQDFSTYTIGKPKGDFIVKDE